MTQPTAGIVQLMDDLGRALTQNPGMRMLGGGNPAAIPAIEALWRTRMAELLAAGTPFDRMLGAYDPPQGNPQFCAALAALLRRTYGWEIGPENVAITPGGQTAFFFLFSLLTQNRPEGRVLLPLTPEYIGYADQGLGKPLFQACRPHVVEQWRGEAHTFKYQIDFDAVRAALRDGNIVAVTVSRPTNPSGNVITDAEVRELAAVTRTHGVPLVLDNAYGAPFPNVMFEPAQPYWEPHLVLTLSLSKLGLPAARTGMVIGPAELVAKIASMTAIVGLANTNIGQQLVLPLVESGEILELGPRILRPFYEERSQFARATLERVFAGSMVEWAVHASEGAFFHWLWLKNLRIDTQELYERLKARSVLVVPGEYFFFGLESPWEHARQCLRLNFAQPARVIEEGLAILAEEAAGWVR